MLNRYFDRDSRACGEYVAELSAKNAAGMSNCSTGRSWKESVGNSTANRAEFLKNQNKNN